ncbi:MAG: Trk system potassium transporter TrkA [Lachnospiraceae bacterium]|nr:Trk system potassium transporter TrkA [Lachnospiraceae bacterium]
MFENLFKENKKTGLKIIIVGCGKVGTTLLQRLRDEGHDLNIIDQNPTVISELSGTYDVLAITGNGATHSVLDEANVKEADLLIAVTESDELNLLTCVLANQASDCATIARVRQPEYVPETHYLREKLGLAKIINPELEAAKEASRILLLPTALEVNTFAHDQVELVKIKVPDDNLVVGLSLAQISARVGLDVLVCVIERNDELIIPTGAMTIQPGDVISVLGQRRIVKKFLAEIGFKTEAVRNCIIVGGGRAAFYLAKHLLQMNIDVKIIENNKERCEYLAEALADATIINGDGTSEELLREEGIEYADAFIPLTGVDEENIFLTLFAKSISKAKVITKINRMNYKNVINSLDLGSVIYPKTITTEAIIAYVRARQNSADRNNIETLYHMYDNRVEAIEFLVDQESEVTGKTFAELKTKDNLLVACISRNGSIIIPRGSDSIHVGDAVTIVTTHTGFNDITDILKK